MSQQLFVIYTAKSGYQVMGFEDFNAEGVSCFNQAIQYVQMTFNDKNDVPRVYQLTEIPQHNIIKRSPAEWEAMYKIEILDDDGWRASSSMGFKSLTELITETEFVSRMSESTIRPVR